MWGNVSNVLAKYEGVFNARPAFMRYVSAFNTAIAIMDEAAEKQGKELGGISIDKETLELKAATQADYVGDIIQAYALEQENNELYRAMMFSASEIMHLRDTVAYDKMREVYSTAATLQEKLYDYGLAKEDMYELDLAIGAYKAKLDAPRGAITERGVATDTIGNTIKAGNRALYGMDKMINTFATVKPDAVAEYKKARIIIDNATGRDGKGDAPKAG